MRDVLRHALYLLYSRCSRRSCGFVCFGSCSLKNHGQGICSRRISCLSCCILAAIVVVESW